MPIHLLKAYSLDCPKHRLGKAEITALVGGIRKFSCHPQSYARFEVSRDRLRLKFEVPFCASFKHLKKLV